MSNEFEGMDSRNLPSQFEEYSGITSIQTIEQIKDGEAINLGYNSFNDLVLHPKQDMKMNHLNWCIERSMKKYAHQQVEIATSKLMDIILQK